MNDADDPFLLVLLFPDVVTFVVLYVCQFMVMMMAVRWLLFQGYKEMKRMGEGTDRTFKGQGGKGMIVERVREGGREEEDTKPLKNNSKREVE